MDFSTFSDYSNTSTPRASTDSTARLVTSQDPPTPRRPHSRAPSTSSIFSGTSSITLTPSVHVQRGFKSRESYLAALNEFAERKMYMEEGEHTLYGVYGRVTMDEYKQRPGLRDDRKRRKAEEAKERNQQQERLRRRETLTSVVKEDGGSHDVELTDVERMLSTEDGEGGTPGKPVKEGRLRRLSRVLIGGRRATVT